MVSQTRERYVGGAVGRAEFRDPLAYRRPTYDHQRLQLTAAVRCDDNLAHEHATSFASLPRTVLMYNEEHLVRNREARKKQLNGRLCCRFLCVAQWGAPNSRSSVSSASRAPHAPKA